MRNGRKRVGAADKYETEEQSVRRFKGSEVQRFRGSKVQKSQSGE
jgi:hypothetical protein